MNWNELSMNPEAVSRLYHVPPPLRSVEVVQVVLHRDGPLASMYVTLTQFPDKPPPKWIRDGFNAITIQFDLFDVRELQIVGWSTDNVVDIDITPQSETRVSFVACSKDVLLKLSCCSFRVAHMTGHVDKA
jgi:hypothetical protein